MLNQSCQVGLSAVMTQFQINLGHIFVLSVLLDCEGTGEFHCPAVILFSLAPYFENSQVCSNLYALLPDLVSLQCVLSNFIAFSLLWKDYF